MSFSKWTSGAHPVAAFLQQAGVVAVLAAFPLANVWAADTVEPLPPPEGPVILTVSGDIAATNSPDGAVFDRQMLADLGVTEITTSTPWTDGVHVFRGILGRTVFERVGAQGTTVMATALNEYTVEIPMSDFYDHDVLLATEMDGEEMKVSDKGPIWIIYPRDDDPVLQSNLLHERWVWQLWALKTQ